jgi:hypothetical protein
MTRFRSIFVVALFALVLALAGARPAAAAPKAGVYQASITSPTAATGSTITITKPSKLIAKVSSGNITFQVKAGGVLDAMLAPVNIIGNTLQIDVIINNTLFTVMFVFDITNGKVSQKFTVANSSMPGGGVVAGQPFEVRAIRLIQGGNGNAFGVGGLTAR